MSDIVDFAIRISSLVLSIAAITIAWVRTRHQAMQSRLVRMEGRLDGHDRADAVAAERLEHMPSIEQINALQARLAEISARIAELDARMGGYRDLLNRIDHVVKMLEETAMGERRRSGGGFE
jgi:flagellar hook-associated protein FlgK